MNSNLTKWQYNKPIDVLIMEEDKIGNLRPVNGGGKRQLYMANFAVLDLHNGTYRVIKDRVGKRVGKIIKEEDLFLEMI